MSNIDTDSIVSQLMAVERRPQQLLQSNVGALQRSQAAWQAIGDKLTALQQAADGLAGTGRAAAMTAVSSSNPAAVAVRSTGSTAASAATVEVVSLATAQSVLAGDAFASPTASDGGRTLQLTIGGTTHTFSSTDGTAGGIADAVNAASLGVRAALLQVSPGSYQLVVTATSTGTANAFTAGGTGWSGFTTARAASDASVVVDGVTVSRSSNVITDLVGGVELTLNTTTAAPVTVAAKRDDEAIVNAVQKLIDAANAAITTVGTLTKTSTDATTRGALAGDFTARRLADRIRSLIASPLTGSGTSAVTATSLGVSLTKDGAITFDAAKLRTALATTPDATLAALGRTGTSDAAGVSVVGSTSAATAGNRQVVVTQAATRASLAAVPVPPPSAGTDVSLNIVTPERTYLVTFEAGASWVETAASLNAALLAAGVKAVATPGASGGIDLAADRFGSAGSFSVGGGADIGLDGSATGQDAAGTIDGVAFTANGRTVTNAGIVYDISATASQLAAAGGSLTAAVSFTDGLAGALSRIGNEATSSGSVTRAKDALADRIADLDARIARYDDQLALREQTLRQKFTAMETLLAKLQSTGASLGFLSSNSSSSSSSS